MFIAEQQRKYSQLIELIDGLCGDDIDLFQAVHELLDELFSAITQPNAAAAHNPCGVSGEGEDIAMKLREIKVLYERLV